MRTLSNTNYGTKTPTIKKEYAFRGVATCVWKLTAFFILLSSLRITALYGDVNALRESFKNPPREYSLLPFWAWNDTLEPEKLKWQIDQMVDKNVYGAFMHARVGINKGKTPYFSEGWWKAVDTALKHGEKVGFYPWLYDEDKWPSGGAGGRTVAVNPEEFSQKGLVFSTMEITGPQQLKLASVEDLVAIIAARFVSRDVVDEKSLNDISKFAGKSWDVPAGRWLVMSFTQITEEIAHSGPQRGIDYLDKEAVAAFIKITHEEYYKRFGKYFGNVVPGIFFDEITAKLTRGDLTWTDDFLEKFEQIKGYDLKKYLPLLVFDGGDITPKIRCDYYDVFTTLYEDAWFRQINDWCNEHNIALTGHTYEDIYSFITQGDYFRTLGAIQIPLTDNEEFRYSFPRFIDWYKHKQLASIANINGRKFAGVEALGGNGQTYTLEELRYGLSMLSVYGLNYFVLHGLFYTIDTPATSADFPPSWFYQNPYWKYFGQVGKFAQRLTYMGSRGHHVCDIAILYPVTSMWASGLREGGLGKKYTHEELDGIVFSGYYDVQKTLLDNKIDYDIIDPASLCKADVSKGKVEISKQSYPVLILPPLSVIKQDTLEKVKNFYNSGGTVIALNTLPLASMEAGKKDPAVIKSLNDIFGFNPLFLRSGYFEVDQTRSEEFITNVNTIGAKAYFTKWIENVPRILDNVVERDVIIKEGEPAGFNFLHKTTGDCDIYYLLNSHKLAKTWTVSFKCAGSVEKWHPETGRTEQIVSCPDGQGRTELTLPFESWESYYIVFDKNAKRPPTGKPTEEWKDSESLKPIELVGEWQFMPVGRQLDYKWQSKVESSQIELPVMDFYAERTGEQLTEEKLLFQDSVPWKQVKITDKWNKTAGCGRYLSCWDGWWITYADLRPHWGTTGGKEIRFQKKINIDGEVKDAWFGITADKRYRLIINGKDVGEDGDWKDAETYEIRSYLKTGTNLFEIVVGNGTTPFVGGPDTRVTSLLAQGQITLSSGRNIKFVSDQSWDVCNETGIWRKAFECVNPPLGPWGNIELSKHPLNFPATLWYRQHLPAGAVGMLEPVIKGNYEIYIDSNKVNFEEGQKQVGFRKFLKGQNNTLFVKVEVNDFSEGLLEPLTLICEPAEIKLDDWQRLGLDWFSGRCVYSKEFEVPAEYLKEDTKLVLDLGDVHYCAEVWVNDKLVETRIWPPYEVQIQDFVKAGNNKLTIVVANLIANEMKWNIFDETLTSRRARWVHDLSLLREPEKLISGLLGPVKIRVMKRRAVASSAYK